MLSSKKTGGLPDRWQLRRLFEVPCDVVPPQADQIELQGIDNVLNDMDARGQRTIPPKVIA